MTEIHTFLDQGPHLIINQPDKLLDGMSAWCKEHHGKVSLLLLFIYLFICLFIPSFVYFLCHNYALDNRKIAGLHHDSMKTPPCQSVSESLYMAQVCRGSDFI